MTLTPEEARRVHVLTLLEGKHLTPAQAAEALGLTPRQIQANSGPAGSAEFHPPAPAHPTVGREADIFAEPLGGHFC
jgi:hypothetical protein